MFGSLSTFLPFISSLLQISQIYSKFSFSEGIQRNSVRLKIRRSP